MPELTLLVCRPDVNSPLALPGERLKGNAQKFVLEAGLLASRVTLIETVLFAVKAKFSLSVGLFSLCEHPDPWQMIPLPHGVVVSAIAAADPAIRYVIASPDERKCRRGADAALVSQREAVKLSMSLAQRGLEVLLEPIYEMNLPMTRSTIPQRVRIQILPQQRDKVRPFPEITDSGSKFSALNFGEVPRPRSLTQQCAPFVHVACNSPSNRRLLFPNFCAAAELTGSAIRSTAPATFSARAHLPA